MEIKNIDLQKVIVFLENLDLKGLKSINRTKVTNHLSEKLEEVAKGEEVIREDFAEDRDRLEEELKAYFEDTVVIEGGEFHKPLEVIKAEIKKLLSEESEESFKGQEAYVLYLLYEAFNLEEEM